MIFIDQYKLCTELIKPNRLEFGLWLDKPTNQSSNNNNRKHETTNSGNSRKYNKHQTNSKLNLATSI